MRKKLCRVSRSGTLGKAPRTHALKSHTRGCPLLIAPAHTRALSLPPLPLTASRRRPAPAPPLLSSHRWPAPPLLSSRRRPAPAPPLLAPRRPGSAASSPPAGGRPLPSSPPDSLGLPTSTHPRLLSKSSIHPPAAPSPRRNRSPLPRRRCTFRYFTVLWKMHI